MPYLGIFWLTFEKSIVTQLKFHAKLKMLNFGIKNALFGYFWAGSLKECCHIWSQNPQNLCKKKRNSHIHNQKCFVWVFCTANLKNYCHIWNQRPGIGLISKFGAKRKILKFGTKTFWFGYFWVGIKKNIVVFEINRLEFVY